jgi:hypothetical protein
LPCAIGSAPEFEPCAELLDFLRTRLNGLDQRIGALTQSREALHSYLDATEQAQGT